MKCIYHDNKQCDNDPECNPWTKCFGCGLKPAYPDDLMKDVQSLCRLICDSPPATPIKGKIESMAFWIGHHPDVLNA